MDVHGRGEGGKEIASQGWSRVKKSFSQETGKKGIGANESNESLSAFDTVVILEINSVQDAQMISEPTPLFSFLINYDSSRFKV